MKLNLDIQGIEGEYIFWTLDGQDGTSELNEDHTSVYDASLCDGPFDMKPDIMRQVREEVQQWLDDKPDKDKREKEWNDRYEYYLGKDGVWAEWMEINPIQHAIPSVYHEPSEYTGLGEVRFVQYGDDYWGDGETVYRSQLYNNPTWGDVMREFDLSIEHCKDFHHCFLEGIAPSKEFAGEINFLTGS